MGFSPGLGVSPGVGNGNPLPLQHSCLENPMDRGAWRAIVRGAAKGRTQLSTQHKCIAMFLIGASVQFSHSVMPDSLQPHGLQHTRPPCPSPTPRVYSNSCPSSQWCHRNISSCHPLLLLPLIFSSIRVFSNESALHIRWPNYWSFSFSISPSNEYSGLISFRMDWLDLLADQGTLKSLLQHNSLKAIYIF